ncbi:MAG: sulfide/dihydroorotate dehydrogenase-like FAD/NAD-binding protein [Dehalococcoidales bacterium]|nr:sulfide/dihydroorotate dehydrogenase-like FAD/NAD-binding protein [Dehalococcoidales bacterium]
MYKILLREDLAPKIHMFKIAAPDVARKAQAGQFVIIRVDEKGERIPLTIADWDREEGSVTIIFNQVGRTTSKLAALQEGQYIANFVGPLGLPAQIDKFGTVILVVGGYSVATIIPAARALKEAGNTIISIIRAPTRETLFGDERLGSFSDRSIIVTGDISSDCDSFIFEPLKQILQNEKINRVITVGPACVMKLVSATTRQFGVKTVASLNPIMIDGTGMCGCCRVSVNGETKFACVDGPEFDANEIDWTTLMVRRCTYSGEPQPVLQYQCRNCAQW